mmetsp:Transcript_26276/g.62228  ORF Transcript_26276/g.62228 Transcript_26276/m.62228 type:complete len:220 (+) Transcript_26276:2729-3388(+)
MAGVRRTRSGGYRGHGFRAKASGVSAFVLAQPIGFARCHQRRPIVRRVAASQHLLEHGVGVGLAARRPQGLLVVDPGVHDDLRLRVVAEEQPIPSSELGSPPVAIVRSHGVALTILVACRIARHHVLHQLHQGPEELDVGVGRKAFRVVLLRTQHGCAQLHQLLDQVIVKQQRPAMLLHQISTSSSKSSPKTTLWPACSSIVRAKSSGRPRMFRPASMS